MGEQTRAPTAYNAASPCRFQTSQPGTTDTAIADDFVFHAKQKQFVFFFFYLLVKTRFFLSKFVLSSWSFIETAVSLSSFRDFLDQGETETLEADVLRATFQTDHECPIVVADEADGPTWLHMKMWSDFRRTSRPRKADDQASSTSPGGSPTVQHEKRSGSLRFIRRHIFIIETCFENTHRL